MEQSNIDHEAQMIKAAAAGGAPLQQIKTSYVTAVSVQTARNLRDVEKRLLQEAELGGESFYYGWAAGKDRIEGPSKELAMSAARCWGNCAVELGPMQETHEAWIFTTYFIDLETGFTSARQFRQSKRWQVYGKLDAERKDDVRFQIGQSKAIRNVVLNSLPASIINAAMDKAKEGVRKKIEKLIESKGIAEAQKTAIDEFKKLGVAEETLLARLERNTVAALNLDDLVIMKGDIDAIRRGAERPEDLYPPIPKKGEESGSRTDAMKDKLAGDAAGEAKPGPGRPKKDQGQPEQPELPAGGSDPLPATFSLAECQNRLVKGLEKGGAVGLDGVMIGLENQFKGQMTDEEFKPVQDEYERLRN